MKLLLLIPALIVGVGLACSDSSAPTTDNSTAVAAERSEHSDPNIQWGPVPSILPAGAQLAVLQGNPFGEGVYTLRLKMPPGYTIPPHFHPTDEMVTVIKGTLLFAHGDVINERTATRLHQGGFVTAPAGEHHYVIAGGNERGNERGNDRGNNRGNNRGNTIVQVHGLGPFAITYVNPQ